MTHIEEEFQTIENEDCWQTFFRKLGNHHGSLTFDKKNDTALLSYNRALNRFRDVLPYDETRVKLQEGHTDYINANYVEVPSANRKYILTQGPLRTTAHQFWQMVWEQNSRVIVMLTHLVEKGSDKCWLYYPDYENDSELTFDESDLKVTFIAEQNGSCYTRRKFELTNLRTGEARSVLHWSNFDWPDHGAPDSAESFLSLLCDIRRCGAFDARYGPPVLHCSAGIGRSGTFVLVDSILKMLAQSENPNEISLTEVLGCMRMQRHGLVQTHQQLRFSYLAIISGMKQLDEIEESEGFFNENDSDLSDGSDAEIDSDDEEDNERKSKNILNEDSQKFSQIHNQSAKSNRMNKTDVQRTVEEETSLRMRQERLEKNKKVQKKVDEIKARLREQDHLGSSSINSNGGQWTNFSILTGFVSKHRRSLLIGLFTVLAGSVCLYKSFYSSDQYR